MGKPIKTKKNSDNTVEVGDFSKFKRFRLNRFTALLLTLLLALVIYGLSTSSYTPVQNVVKSLLNSANQGDKSTTESLIDCSSSLRDSGLYEEIIDSTSGKAMSIERKREIRDEINKLDYKNDQNCLYILTALNIQLSDTSGAKSSYADLTGLITEAGNSVDLRLVFLGGTVDDLGTAIEYVSNQENDYKNNTFYCCSEDTGPPEGDE